MTNDPKPDQSILQRKQYWASLRRWSHYAAFAGGVLMIPFAVFAVSLFLPDIEELQPLLDHVRLIGVFSIIGCTLLGGGLGFADHCRKQYRKLELSEMADTRGQAAAEDDL